jgi:uncharacterized protein GlcG (DUF336 family)
MLVLSVALPAVPVDAQGPPPYGTPITLDQVLAGAEAEAKENSWNVVITVVDPGGQPVAMSRLDNTQFGSIEVAREKAYSAVAFAGRPRSSRT